MLAVTNTTNVPSGETASERLLPMDIALGIVNSTIGTWTGVVGRVTTSAGHVGLGYVARSVVDGRMLDAAIDVVTVTH